MSQFIRYTLPILLLLIMTAVGASAQTRPDHQAKPGIQPEAEHSDKWSGSVELTSGFGINHLKSNGQVTDTLTHLLEQVNLKLSRSTSTFSIATQAQGVFEKNETYTRRVSMKGENTAEILGRKSEFFKPGSTLRSDIGWCPTTGWQLTAYLSYHYGFDHTDDYSASIITNTSDIFQFKTALDESKTHQHLATAGWQTSHHLGSPRRQFLTAGEWKGTFSRQESLWTKLMLSVEDLEEASNDSKSIVYRLTPRMNDYEGAFSFSCRDTLISGTHQLTIEPGVKSRLFRTLDKNDGAIRIDDDTWRDSTGLHEDFDFLALQLEPQLRLEYRYSTLRLSTEYGL